MALRQVTVAARATAGFRRQAVRCVPGSFVGTSTALCGGSLPVVLHVSCRRYVNALYRLPPLHTIPTHSPSGEEIDTELFCQQMRRLFEVMKMSQLMEMAHEMKSCPYFESIFTSDLFFQHYEVLIPMPKFGREHRSSEMSETVRYIRASGGSASLNHVLQDVKGGRASGSDFVATPHGVLFAYGTPRTNKVCADAMLGGNPTSASPTATAAAAIYHAIEVKPDCPPLAEIMAFAGSRTLIIKDTAHGHYVANRTMELLQKLQWQVVKVEPNCSFLSHMCGTGAVFDVLCDQDFPESMERIGESGLNPFPVEWSEPRKLGISMHSVCLIARFARGGLTGGGQWENSSHRQSEFHYHSRDIAKNARLFQDGRRRHGDSGAPLAAQLRAGELLDPVYQPPPRYAPPMHRRGPIVPQS